MAESLTASCPVTGVTLYEDRAQVQREGVITLREGSSTIVIPGVSPVVSDRHATARLSGPGCARIVALRVERRRSLRRGERPGRFQELLDAIERLAGERAIVADGLAGVTAALEALDEVVCLTCEELAEDAARGRVAGSGEAAALQDLGRRGEELIARQAELTARLRGADRSLADLQAQHLALPVLLDLATDELAALVPAAIAREHRIVPVGMAGRTLVAISDGEEQGDGLGPLPGIGRVMILRVPTADLEMALAAWYPERTADRPWRAELVLVVEAEGPGAYRLEIAYVVPNACWRPCHVARASGAQLEMVQEACIWQRTGEDWNGAVVWCSTARASLGVEPPRLESDELRLTPKQAAVVVETREQEIETTGGAAGGPTCQLAGIDDGGEERRLRVAERVDIPCDGLAHRFPVAAFTVPMAMGLVVQAELAPAAILRSAQANAGSLPLLAGPVELIRDGGCAGRGTLLFVAPGASFALGWGPDPELRVIRECQTQEEKRSLLDSWCSTRHVVTVHLVNLGAAPRTLTVIERIPVSEIDKVIIEVLKDETRPPGQGDADGLIRWQVELAPRGRAELRLVWRMRRHPEVRFS